MPIPPLNYDQSVICGNLSRRVYTVISDDMLVMHYKYIKWRTELGNIYTDSLSEFCTSHKDIYKITNTSKYRSFQYRAVTERACNRRSII